MKQIRILLSILVLLGGVALMAEAAPRPKKPVQKPAPSQRPSSLPAQKPARPNNSMNQRAGSGNRPQLSAQQQQNVTKLQQDMRSLAQSGPQSKDEVQKLATDLSTMVDQPP